MLARSLGLLLVTTALTPGCFTFRQVGLSETPLQPQRTTTAVCLRELSGAVVEIREGSVDGMKAVSADGIAIGFASTLNESLSVDGLEIYAGQNCVMSEAPFCDHVAVLKLEERRYALFWQVNYSSPSELPASGRAMAEKLARDTLLEKVRSVDLDERTYAAFEAISESRRTGTLIRTAGLLGGATAVSVGAHSGDPEMVEAGIDTFEDGRRIAASLSADELALVKSHPKLIPVLQIIQQLGMNGTFCASRPAAH